MYETDYVYPLGNGYYVQITERYKDNIYPSIQKFDGKDFKKFCDEQKYYIISESNTCIYGDKLFILFSDVLYEVDLIKYVLSICRFNINNIQFLDKGIVAEAKTPDRNDLMIFIDPFSLDETIIGKLVSKNTLRK